MIPRKPLFFNLGEDGYAITILVMDVEDKFSTEAVQDTVKDSQEGETNDFQSEQSRIEGHH